MHHWPQDRPKADGNSSAAKRCTISPAARKGSRLVDKMATRGATLRIVSASGAAAAMTCSQLSSTIRACLSRNHAASACKGLAPDGGIPSAALGIKSGSARDANPTNQTPSSYDRRTASATATASVVANPARTDDGHETTSAQLCGQRHNGLLAADDARERCRQIAGFGLSGRLAYCRQRVLARHRRD